MSFPVYFHLFGLTINPHFIFEALAYSLGFATFRLLQRHFGDPVPHDIRWSVIAAAVAGAAIGSKILYWLEDPARVLHNWSNWQVVWGGKTIVGGLIGGLAAVEYAKKKMAFSGRTGDLFALPLCVGIAVGRIGCFLSGLNDDTYGTPTSLPWGINFGDGVTRHPTQIYEIIFLICLSSFLLGKMRRPRVHGDIFKIFMVGYFGWRFLIDFLKPDPRFLLLNSLQWACVVTLLYYSGDIGRWIGVKTKSAVASAAT
ncbi:MAG TPA: prolipoprotein diacylglyceryl transferase family protein [Candidatus Angelobacter sp.]|jgi:prolipoprotein diacylglyceryltransferase